MILSHQASQSVAESRPVNINLPHLAYTVQTFLFLQEVQIDNYNKIVACFIIYEGLKFYDIFLFLNIYLQVEQIVIWLVTTDIDIQLKIQNYKGMYFVL